MAGEASHELSVERYIAAPPDTVWKIMTERLAEWWCPKPWRTEIDAIEWHAGGRFDVTMHGPSGEVSPNHGIFLEVSPGRRMVFADAMKGGWHPQPAFMIGLLELAPEGEGTRYRASARHWDEASMRQHEEMGFVEGWEAVARQLAELVESGR